MEKKRDKVFSYLREIFWPIYGVEENLKFISLLIMMASAIFVYNLLRISKDTYILSSYSASANTISFIKSYLVTPFSILYFTFFCFVSNRLSRQYVFLIALSPMFVFFILFYLVFLPNAAFFHISNSYIHFLQTKYPHFRNAIPVFGYWAFSLFYIMAELLGTFCITFLFWSFANSCVKKEETKRFFPLLASYSYVSFIIAALIQRSLYQKSRTFPAGSDKYLNVFFLNFYLIIGSLTLYLLMHYLILKYFSNTTDFVPLKKKKKLSFTEGIHVILQSKYLLGIVLLVVTYGLTSNLLEITWKELVREELNGLESSIGEYLSNFYIKTGITTIILGVINRILLKQYSWRFANSIVPSVLFLSSFVFFFLIVFPSFIPNWLFFGYSSAYVAMSIGFYQDNLIKSCKYSILDPNVQMLYQPLDEDLRVNGKAAVDVIGAKLGKSMGSFLESSLSVIFKGANQIMLAPIFMPIVLGGFSVWLFALMYLSTEYSRLTKGK